MLCNTSRHLWPNLIAIMKREDYIRPTGAGEDLVRTGLALDTPADAEQCGENTLRFG